MTNTNNVSMKKGFTMIELIFVIVIIGILAAVAIPKLAATRTDAKVSKTVANLRTLIEDSKNYYTANGADTIANPTTAWGAVNWNSVTDAIPVAVSKTIVSNAAITLDGETGTPCFTITPDTGKSETRNGVVVPITVLTITPENVGDQVCAAAQAQADSKGFFDVEAGTIDHKIGGGGVNF